MRSESKSDRYTQTIVSTDYGISRCVIFDFFSPPTVGGFPVDGCRCVGAQTRATGTRQTPPREPGASRSISFFRPADGSTKAHRRTRPSVGNRSHATVYVSTRFTRTAVRHRLRAYVSPSTTVTTTTTIIITTCTYPYRIRVVSDLWLRNFRRVT